MSYSNSQKKYDCFTAKMAVNLAAPHTWPAAIIPALVATCAASRVSSVSISMALVLLVIVVAMQSAVNTFNDYYDYVKGTDSDDADVDESDAVLVYNNVDPKAALRFAIGLLVASFLLGIYAIVVAGITPLVIALIGALIVVLYSAGKSPISYLPIGELVSGFVMGALIPLAVYQVLTGILDFRVLVWSIPLVIGIALIMFTNNTCDIERDIPAGRKTLPILLGRQRAVSWYRALLVAWMVAIVANVAIWFSVGMLLVPFMLLASYPFVKAVYSSTFTPDRRRQAMPQILCVNVVLGAFYAAEILAGGALTLVL